MKEAAADTQGESARQDEIAVFRMQSSTLGHNEPIPEQHLPRGADRSPAICWSGCPSGTKSIALIVDNPDAVRGFRAHWIVYNIPVTRSRLPEDVSHRGDLSDGTLQGKNDFGQLGWRGPNPDPGVAARYRFRLYALDTVLPLGPGATLRAAEDAIRGHVLAMTEMMTTATTPLFAR